MVVLNARKLRPDAIAGTHCCACSASTLWRVTRATLGASAVGRQVDKWQLYGPTSRCTGTISSNYKY